MPGHPHAALALGSFPPPVHPRRVAPIALGRAGMVCARERCSAASVKRSKARRLALDAALQRRANPLDRPAAAQRASRGDLQPQRGGSVSGVAGCERRTQRRPARARAGRDFALARALAPSVMRSTLRAARSVEHAAMARDLAGRPRAGPRRRLLVHLGSCSLWASCAARVGRAVRRRRLHSQPAHAAAKSSASRALGRLSPRRPLAGISSTTARRGGRFKLARRE